MADAAPTPAVKTVPKPPRPAPAGHGRLHPLSFDGCVGAVAFSRSGDPTTGDFGDTKVIRKFGDVPEDLSAL